jgi:hypothetical protein
MEQNGIPKWGYVFHRASIAQQAAYVQLDVNIPDRPTEQHYDPERLTIPTIDPSGAILPLTVVHPWHGKELYALSPGRVVICDRKGKLVEAAIAGAELAITGSPHCTCCRINSPVPLYRLAGESGAGPESVATAIVDKIEALIAICRVRWGRNELAFQQRLTGIDPIDFYAASLHSVQASLDRTPSTQRGQRYQIMVRALHIAIEGAKGSGIWPVHVQYLEELL